MYDEMEFVQKIEKLEGNAYVLKSADKEELLDCFDSLINQKFYIGKSVKSCSPLYQIFSDKFAGKIKLTKREIEVMQLIIKGDTTTKISEKLFVSINTIETHRKNIFKKLQVKSLGELIHFAYGNGLI